MTKDFFTIPEYPGKTPPLIPQKSDSDLANRKQRIERGLAYLEANVDIRQGFVSYIAPEGNFLKRSVSPSEVFSSLVISQCLLDMNLSPDFFRSIPSIIQRAVNQSGFVHFFFDHKLLVADIDCTAVAYAILIGLKCIPQTLPAIVDRLMNNIDGFGIIEVYEKPAGSHSGRIDACAIINTLYLLYATGKINSDITPSEKFIYDTLRDRTYLNGTRYYPSPDTFLYFLSRLVRDYPHARSRYGNLLILALQERRGHEGLFLENALRAAAFDNIGLRSKIDQSAVLIKQTRKGYWPADTFFRYGSTNRCFGSEALSTAICMRALFSSRSKTQKHLR